MAFLYPRYFPEDFGCVQEVDSDPANTRIDSIQYFPVGLPLEKAMALVWKSRKFYCSGTAQYPFEDCLTFSSYAIHTTNSESTSNTPLKMSDLICPNAYNANFLFTNHSIYYKCSGGIEFEIDGEDQFEFIPSLGIYLYNNLYYLPIFYSFGPATNLKDFNNYTYYAGNLNIDTIIFPLYVPDPSVYTGGIAKANYTCSTILERVAK
jgi:hypothetical protein